jgi:hypothetical protein
MVCRMRAVKLAAFIDVDKGATRPPPHGDSPATADEGPGTERVNDVLLSSKAPR